MADEPSTPTLRLERDGGLAWIVFSNVERMNALNAAMWARLPELVAEAEASSEVRVIVLRGEGMRAFSAGADISEFQTARTGDNAKSYDALNHAAFEALSSAVKPTIAMIHGFCLGGGLGLAACCDLRLADDKSTFAIPAAKLGLGYNPRWLRPLLAIARAPFVKELLFTGRRFQSDDAYAAGLVNRITAPDDLERLVREIAGMISGNAPLTIQAAKLAIDELTRNPEHPDTARLDAAVERCFESDDYAEGRAAFLEKRKPVFRGK